MFTFVATIKKLAVLTDTKQIMSHFGHPSNVETVKRASIPLRILSKLSSELIHSLLRTTISCSAPSWYFIYQPLGHRVGEKTSRLESETGPQWTISCAPSNPRPPLDQVKHQVQPLKLAAVLGWERQDWASFVFYKMNSATKSLERIETHNFS